MSYKSISVCSLVSVTLGGINLKRSKIFESIVNSFESKFSFIGKQFAEELLLSSASWNIQQVSQPDFRVRRHLMLFWPPGFLKSSLLVKGYDLLGSDLSTKLSDITVAALRGTVEFGRFVSPYTLKRPFSICTEFGQIISGHKDEELIQKLLNILEEGAVTVSLGKISSISNSERDRVMDEFPVTFIDANTFTYTTNWIMIAGTYNRKFLIDSALESRFNILVPDQPLSSKLTKHVINSPPFAYEPGVEDQFRNEVTSTEAIDTKIKIPTEVYDADDKFSPRDAGMIVSRILCMAWWGKKLANGDVVELAVNIKKNRDRIWKSTDDKVFDIILYKPRTFEEIKAELKAQGSDVSERQVYYSLKKIGAHKTYSDDLDTVKYAIK